MCVCVGGGVVGGGGGGGQAAMGAGMQRLDERGFKSTGGQ